jgi:crotonobetainyl-CoA:carnitine CoA-transferase CaiB-like acyl-CoA transferase
LTAFRPLAGLRVVDVTTSLAGPYCTEVLGAFGADVIKIEPPGTGDEARAWGPPFHEGTATLFLTANANKRSVAVELRRGSEIVLRLAERADVLVVSLRPGLAEARGLAAADVRARNDRLVYASISGFGSEGPLASRPGYDPLAQAAAGILSVTGEPDRDPVRVGVSLVDQTTGVWAALSILAALRQRDANGGGATIELSLYATAVSLMGYHLAGYAASGAVPGRHGTAFPSIAPYEAFAAADGRLMLAVGNDRTFASFCGVVGLERLVDDPLYASNGERVRNRAALRELVAERLAGDTRDRWLERFAAANVPAAPVQDTAEVLAHPQTEALGLLQLLGGLPVARLPVAVDGERPDHVSAAPPLGRDTDAVLLEAGYAAAEIAGLRESGVIG